MGKSHIFKIAFRLFSFSFTTTKAGTVRIVKSVLLSPQRGLAAAVNTANAGHHAVGAGTGASRNPGLQFRASWP